LGKLGRTLRKAYGLDKPKAHSINCLCLLCKEIAITHAQLEEAKRQIAELQKKTD
jgi:hypothetical protein